MWVMLQSKVSPHIMQHNIQVLQQRKTVLMLDYLNLNKNKQT